MKKFAICLGLLLCTLASFTAGAQEYPRGDVNQDENVNIADVTSLIDYLLNMTPTAQEYPRCDVNLDGNVNIADVTCLIDYLLNGTWPGEPVTPYEWVDLGLPSGTLWATCNVGAETPEGYGDYFAWGETTPIDNYNWDTYKWCNGTWDTLTKYCYDGSYGADGYTDDKTELDSEDDAAYVNWGPSWRMPTTEQQTELYQKCSSVGTTQNGVNGRLFTGPNGNTLFLPFTGYREGVTLYGVGEYGDYWSRTLDYDGGGNPDFAIYLGFGSGGPYSVYWARAFRYNGYTVRAVRASQN